MESKRWVVYPVWNGKMYVCSSCKQQCYYTTEEFDEPALTCDCQDRLDKDFNEENIRW
jgi:hypothetical protein